MNLIEESYSKLQFEKKDEFSLSIEYNNRFKGYNANIKRHNRNIDVFLSKKWKSVDKEIQIGIIQHLLLKLFKKKQETENTKLYNIFLKKVHIAIPKNKIDSSLKEIFDEVNEKYFLGSVDCPNMVWGKETRSRLGSYDFNTDTITISKNLKNTPKEYTEYVMYHEMLHKKLKFENKKGRNNHHTKEFREMEKKFENYSELEKSLPSLVKKKKSLFWFF